MSNAKFLNLVRKLFSKYNNDKRQSWINEPNRRLDKQQSWINEPNRRLDEQQSWINEQNSRLDEQQGWIDEQNRRLDEQQGWINEQNRRLDEQQGWINEQNRRLDEQQSWFYNVEEKQKSLQNQINIVVQTSSIHILKEKSVYNISKSPKVIQIVPVLKYGDAIGNETIAVKQLLRDKGYATEIFTYQVDIRLQPGTAQLMDWFPSLEPNDIVLYRLAGASNMMDFFKNLSCKRALIYHNITPPGFFHNYDLNQEFFCQEGLTQLKELIPYVDYCMAVSEFNKQDLISTGYSCPIDVVPKFIRYADYQLPADDETTKQWKTNETSNVIFVGRVVPNKKFEDIIYSFSAYQKTYDSDARLFFVGSYEKESAYYKYLQDITHKLEVKNIYFTGHISFSKILSYYLTANLFLCMSEHEGFCVPLVEAMYFNIPIIAYDSSAIGETLGNSGVLLKSKDPQLVADRMHEILTDEKAREKVLQIQKQRLKIFSNENVEKEFFSSLSRIELQKQ